MDNRQIKFFLYEQYHAKTGIGSSRIRGHYLIKYWRQAGLYRYGSNPDVLIFQKIYINYDYKFPRHFEGLKILDICDPDWIDTPDIFVNETLDAMDAVVASTQELADYLQQRTDTPCVCIKDRFDIEEVPQPKVHTGEAKNIVWFGYSHNATLLKFAVPSFETRGFNLTIISNEDPFAYKWAAKPDLYVNQYRWVKYNQDTIYQDLQQHDIAVLPKDVRVFGRFKSENKTVMAELAGLPVAKDTDQLEALMTAEARNKHVEDNCAKFKKDYDVRKSVKEYQELIESITKRRSLETDNN